MDRRSRGKKREKHVMSIAPRATKANGGVWRVGNNSANAAHEERFAHLVKLAARGLARALQMRLTEHAVSYGHWTFLRILWEEEGLTQRELSARAGVMEPTTFAALKAMAQRGYVTRRRNPQSRKEMQVFLTPQGRALQAKLVLLAEEINDVALRGVAAADIAATRRTLLALINNLLADERAAPTPFRRMPSTRELSRLARRARAKI
jgi:DNA-binding MarR family transcriptional regulator